MEGRRGATARPAGVLGTRVMWKLTLASSPAGHSEGGATRPHRTRNLRYRGTSPVRKRLPLGPYCRPMPRVLGTRKEAPRARTAPGTCG